MRSAVGPHDRAANDASHRSGITMTSVSSAAAPRRETTASRREPLIVAVKPYEEADAVVAMAQWLASTQGRPLHAVTVLELQDTLAIAAGVPVISEQYHEGERVAIADLLEQRLGRGAVGLDLEQR